MFGYPKHFVDSNFGCFFVNNEIFGYHRAGRCQAAFDWYG